MKRASRPGKPQQRRRTAATTKPRQVPSSSSAPQRPAAGLDTSLVLRAARRDDIQDITALDERITGLPKRSHWLDLFERQDKPVVPRIFLVATSTAHPARLLGFIVGEIRAWEFGSAPCGWVYALAVDPDSRLLGVGEAMLGAMAREFRKSGVNKMRTMVARNNLLPMLFFRGEGMMAGPYIQLEKDLD